MPLAATTRQAANAAALTGKSTPRPAESAMTMNTTSSLSSSTALKLATSASKSSRCSWRRACSRNSCVSLVKAMVSSCNGISPAARRMALRSQRMPNSKSKTPMAICRT